MATVDDTPITMRRFRAQISRLRRRFIPYLVWHGQEIDARLIWKEARLQPLQFRSIGDMAAYAAKNLNTGRMAEIEKMLSEIGVSFDKGAGPGGRDWELDWSLNGPLSVKFMRPCKTPEKRG